MGDERTIADNYEHVNNNVFYIPTSIPGKGCNLEEFQTRFLINCNCRDNCDDSLVCFCIKNYGQNYVKTHTQKQCDEDTNNKTLVLKSIINADPIFECNDNCGCNVDNCENRLLQVGPFPNLEIISSGKKGYGVRTTRPMLRGQFVCEYAGEVISMEEATERTKTDRGNNYIFWLNEHFPSDSSDYDEKVLQVAIDATTFGNIGRYINHSCEPNCKVIPVRIDSLIPKLGIFTSRTIQKYEEITYDYAGDESVNHLNEDSESDERKLCYCESKKCRKYLPFNRQ